MVKSKIFYVHWYLFIANNFILCTHITHMRKMRNCPYAYGQYKRYKLTKAKQPTPSSPTGDSNARIEPPNTIKSHYT